jgi:hypothetical protein
VPVARDDAVVDRRRVEHRTLRQRQRRHHATRIRQESGESGSRSRSTGRRHCSPGTSRHGSCPAVAEQ